MQLRFQSQMEEWIGHQHLQGLSSPTKLMLLYSRRTLPMSRQKNHGDKGSITHEPRQQQRESMRVLSQFMCTRMCCLREKQVVQIMLTLTDRFTHLFLSHIPYSGKLLRGAHFRYLAPEHSVEMFASSQCLRLNARKPHPPIALHVKYRCVHGSLSHFRVFFLPLKNAPHENLLLYGIRLYDSINLQNFYTCTFTWILIVCRGLYL